ncbi:MAG: hypothetical protein WA693_02800, partial [Pseudolabrys sp.]
PYHYTRAAPALAMCPSSQNKYHATDCPLCGGSFHLKAKVRRVSQRSQVRYLQCFDCKQIVVCNYKTQRAGLAEQVA